MQVPKAVFTRRAFLGLAGATAMLALAASAAFAAGMPALAGSGDPTSGGSPTLGASQTASATASDRDDAATLKPSENPSSEARGTSEPSEAASQGIGKSDLVGACNALHGQAYAGHRRHRRGS